MCSRLLIRVSGFERLPQGAPFCLNQLMILWKRRFKLFLAGIDFNSFFARCVFSLLPQLPPPSHLEMHLHSSQLETFPPPSAHSVSSPPPPAAWQFPSAFSIAASVFFRLLPPAKSVHRCLNHHPLFSPTHLQIPAHPNPLPACLPAHAQIPFQIFTTPEIRNPNSLTISSPFSCALQTRMKAANGDARRVILDIVKRSPRYRIGTNKPPTGKQQSQEAGSSIFKIMNKMCSNPSSILFFH